MATARDIRLQKALLNQQRARESVSSGGTPDQFGDAGPPNWNRGAWDAFHAQYGHYPYGPQGDGSVLYPPTFTNCPAWAYERMGLRPPPITVEY